MVASEPDMESLLASIRKAIDTDIGENTKPQTFTSAPLKGSVHELRMKFENDLAKSKASANEILALRNRIGRNRTADTIVEPLQRHPGAAPSASSRNGFAAILAGDLAARGASPRGEPTAEPPYLRPTLQEREPPWQNHQEPESGDTDPAGGDDGQSYLPVVHDGYGNYAPQPLMSDRSAVAANESFTQLADTLMARALGERSIEDMTQDLLRGMLKNWLDAHLPNLVERLVREEIERVARRGR